jgi:hyaluronoglucosaminidase
VRGIIEGFYGTPWTWKERRTACRVLAGAGMDCWVYAPKDDPLHRQRWREPYPDRFHEEVSALAADTTMRVGFGISPGLSMDPDDDADRAALAAKVGASVDAGVTLVGLLFDDIPPAEGLGAAHGRLTAWLRDRLPASVDLFFVPLHYTGTEAPPYLRQLATEVPDDVPIAWTGGHVVNDTITAADARAWSEAMGGRRPLLWDNTPVNDVVMADRLFLGPLRGRDPDLPALLSGYLANPMTQAAASLPPLLSAAAWLAGGDPEAAWEDAIGDAAVLAECCDPRRLPGLCDRAVGGDAAAAQQLDEILAAAATCDDGGLGAQVAPWVEQTRAEAAVARVALQVLTGDDATARSLAGALVLMWPPLRTASVTVMGGRGSMRPMMGQDEASRWVTAAGARVPPASVVDRLVAAAFDRL